MTGNIYTIEQFIKKFPDQIIRLFMSSVKQKQICKNLENIVEKIFYSLVVMGDDPSQYKGLNKIKMIAENNDIGGFGNLIHYLDNDSRTIYDNRLCNAQLENYLELAYKEISKL